MAYNKVITYESGKNFIESEVGLVQKTMMAQQTNAETVGDRKLIKAGSVFPTNATGAKGIVLDTVDMTDDEKKTIGIIVAGRIYKNRLAVSLDSTAETELEASGIVFLDAPDAEF